MTKEINVILHLPNHIEAITDITSGLYNASISPDTVLDIVFEALTDPFNDAGEVIKRNAKACTTNADDFAIIESLLVQVTCEIGDTVSKHGIPISDAISARWFLHNNYYLVVTFVLR